MLVTTPTIDFGVEIPFVRHLGFVLTLCADGRSEILYTPQPEHLNSYSVTHGGAMVLPLLPFLPRASSAKA